MDPAQMWPMNLDQFGPVVDPNIQNPGNTAGNTNGVFMGATTPGGSANMM